MVSRGTHVLHPGCAVVVACAAVALLAGVAPAPAGAATAPASAASGSARAADGDPWLAGIARALRRDPVYVSDSVSRAVSPGEIARLRAAVRAMPYPTRVAVLSGPPSSFDLRGPSVFDVPELLAGAIDRPGLYVVADAGADFGSVHMTTVGVRPRVPADDARRAVDQDVVSTARVAARIRYALRVVSTGARPQLGAADRELKAAERGDNRDAVENGVAIGFAGGGGVAGFAIPTAIWWRRRRGLRPRGARPVRVVAQLREPGAEAGREAAAAVARLAEAIAAAGTPSEAAFDRYSAAAKAEREARTPVDSVGALVLAQDGEDAVAGRRPRERCFFDPAHGGAMSATRWRRGQEEAEVPACPRCARAIGDGHAPDALADRGRPYYERDTVWARTGFGTIDEDLADKVLAGR